MSNDHHIKYKKVDVHKIHCLVTYYFNRNTVTAIVNHTIIIVNYVTDRFIITNCTKKKKLTLCNTAAANVNYITLIVN